VRDKHDLNSEIELIQDDDVLDTWFSSALWPLTTLGWPEKTETLKTYYPTSVLVTGFDIIFFWVARMIMMGLKFMDDVPFRHVYIHPLVRDPDGQKMSKSKGNILDPLDFVDGVDLDTLVKKRTEGMMQPHLKAKIERATRKEFPDGIPAFGTDALRYTIASLATSGRDVRFELPRIDGYHRFCNKLWNAASYVFGQLDELSDGERTDTIADRWIRSRMHHTIREMHESYANYRLDLVAQTLYDFTWREFCDWYLELTKPILTDPHADEAERRATRSTLSEVLASLFKLLHPLIPFLSEELWLKLCARTGQKSDSLMLESMPETNQFDADDEAEQEMEWLKQVIVGIRQIRGEMNISPAKILPVKLAGYSELDRRRAELHNGYIRKLARIEDIEFIDSEQSVPGAATAILGEMRILVPLVGLIDVAQEQDRLGKQLFGVRTDLEKAQRKLRNEQFVSNAPDEVVYKERTRVEELATRADQLSQQLQRLAEID